MYVECVVHLCVTTKQTDRCSDPCTGTPDPTILDSIMTRSYTVRSGPVSLLKVTETSTTAAKPQSATPVAQPSTSQATTSTASRCECFKTIIAIVHISVTRHIWQYLCSSLFQLWIPVQSGWLLCHCLCSCISLELLWRIGELCRAVHWWLIKMIFSS